MPFGTRRNRILKSSRQRNLNVEQAVFDSGGKLHQRLSGLLRRSFDGASLGVECTIVTGAEETIVLRLPVHLATEMGANTRQRNETQMYVRQHTPIVSVIYKRSAVYQL